MKTCDGSRKGKIRFYCNALEVSREAFYNYLERKENPWKYEELALEMKKIHEEDECNDCYGRVRMYQALKLKEENGEIQIKIPSEATVRKVMVQIGMIHHPKRKAKGITKADKEARKSENLIKRDFYADEPLKKAVTDITEIPAKDGKLYVSAIFDCFDLAVLGISMSDNMRAELCVESLKNAYHTWAGCRGMILHSDRGSQYTSEVYRKKIALYGIRQSMNSASGRCHDNARCESMWARMKEELFYSRNKKTEDYTIEELKSIIWRYFISYWNHRRICSANGGLPPLVLRRRYNEQRQMVA